MSLVNIDSEQRWVPTHVQVTVLRGRGLRAKGKHGTSDVYTIIQVGKEKFTTAVVEKTTSPEWNEECIFELLPGVLEPKGRSAYPPGSGDLVLTLMHRALIGLDVFLGQTVIPLDKVFQERIYPKNEWYKLHSKSGKREKERGEVQVTVQFTRNNLTASMYDLSMKDKPRSALGKLKDRVKGKKRGDAETNSAIVPRGYAALSGSGRLTGDGGDDEDAEEGALTRKGKIKGFFGKGKLRKTSDTRSSTSLTSEGSTLSSPGGSLSPTAGISMVVSDLSNSPSNSSNLTADNSPVHTTQPSPLLMTHKRAFSDEASKVTAFLPWPRAVENLKVQSAVLSRSTLCINGSHIYGGEPAVPRSVSVLQTRLGLLDKCSPLSRSLQNLTRRSEDPARAVGAVRRWSFDRGGKEEKSIVAPAPKQPVGGLEDQVLGQVAPAAPVVKPEAASEEKKPKKNLFSQGKSDSTGKGIDLGKSQPNPSGPTTEERHRGWFGTKDPQNKPSPHPVKPLTATVQQGEKKTEGRSVLVSGLEKLRSTIHPRWAASQSETEADRSKPDSPAQYQHLTHSELVALLLQKEAELEKQKAELEKQGALLDKREVELKKMKMQVRDLEDYIDRLLVRIMEQTPALLQVRSRYK
ncbi:rab11 family-interacting protein 5-like isoform X2 [Brienomyrus brachyistius]|uniref:rab11 family-interacting protein 5-like isoform X2 n=1 Tax=Brienomyrus brachyistius TaxID=42636 RepID=UPI0020B236A1|nr:rab11 family-interacting protein 5-like isoform X2 [Brienomyrus brachyistius]